MSYKQTSVEKYTRLNIANILKKIKTIAFFAKIILTIN